MAKQGGRSWRLCRVACSDPPSVYRTLQLKPDAQIQAMKHLAGRRRMTRPRLSGCCRAMSPCTCGAAVCAQAATGACMASHLSYT